MKKRMFQTIAAGCISGLFFAVVAASSHAQAPAAQQTPPPASMAKEQETSDKTISMFQGIKWGTSLQDARPQLEKRNVQIDEKRSSDQYLYLQNVDVAGYKPEAVIMQFDAVGGLYQARVQFPKQSSNKTVAFYNEVKDIVKEKYGKPKSDVRQFIRPFSQGDGYDEIAIADNKAFIASFWYFKDGLDNRTLILKIYEDLHVYLFYQDDKRAVEHVKRDKQERAKKL